MGKMERTTITLPKGLRDRAHNARINISGITSAAVLDALQEKETGAIAAKLRTPAVTPCGGTHDLSFCS